MRSSARGPETLSVPKQSAAVLPFRPPAGRCLWQIDSRAGPGSAGPSQVVSHRRGATPRFLPRGVSDSCAWVVGPPPPHAPSPCVTEQFLVRARAISQYFQPFAATAPRRDFLLRLCKSMLLPLAVIDSAKLSVTSRLRRVTRVVASAPARALSLWPPQVSRCGHERRRQAREWVRSPAPRRELSG
jgi:hypothetical protein